VSIQLPDEQIPKWRLLWEERDKDSKEKAHRQKINDIRRNTQKEILPFMNKFLSDEITLEEFRSTYDRKTRTEWTGFGLKGLSGAMYLNILVKHVPNKNALIDNLKQVLPVPRTEEEGRKKMENFFSFINELHKTGKVKKQFLQPMRVPFFISSWWHLQDVEQWPIFYISARLALEAEGVYKSIKDPIQDYFTFRDCFTSLATALGIDSWECEHLCSWRQEVKYPPSPVPPKPGEETPPVVKPPVSEPKDENGDTLFSHTQIQMLLTQMGRKLGCSVWVASNDQGKEWEGTSFKDLCLQTLPSLGMDKESQKLICLIDVLWIKGGKQVAAAYEIEHSTSIYSGLLRMSDLITVSPNINFPLYIVTPEKRIEKVKSELSRPTFQTLELHKRCGFFSYETLVDKASSIMAWASDPSTIEKLASKVEDATEE